MKLAGLALAAMWLGGVAGAAPLTLSVLPPATPAAAGGGAEVEIAALNRGTAPAAATLPDQLAGTLRQGSARHAVTLAPAGPSAAAPVTVAPGAFATRRYAFQLPTGIDGAWVLELAAAGQPLRGVIEVTAAAPLVTAAAQRPSTAAEAPSAVARAPVGRPGTPPSNLVPAQPAASALQRTFASRLATHEPIYFVYGEETPAAKFQFSFKYRLLDFTERTRPRLTRTLQFAYTQRSLWDINAVSSPFYDTSYMPELFFESLAYAPDNHNQWFTWLGGQGGYKHESNGRAGDVSRSLNTVFLRGAFAMGDLDHWYVLVAPEVFTYIGGVSDNRHLTDYRGYGQLRLVLGRNGGPALMTTLHGGRRFSHGTVQFDLTVPVRTKFLNFETFLLLQYFNGYGETLLKYDEHSEALRAGISLVR
jgi:outer membrane phospholipase A